MVGGRLGDICGYFGKKGWGVIVSYKWWGVGGSDDLEVIAGGSSGFRRFIGCGVGSEREDVKILRFCLSRVGG